MQYTKCVKQCKTPHGADRRMSDPDSALSAAALRDRFAAGSLRPSEAVEGLLARIRRYDPVVNSFTCVTAERALAAAAESDRRWRAGRPLGPLDGMPFSAKDTLMVEGVPFRRGSRATADTLASASAPVVARVLEQGGCLLGITTTPEFGVGPITISPLTGITRNPWDTSRNSGGSSGGAAAGVAAGFSPLALATDAGGSTRIPAGFCGVVGIKPTGGRVPTWPPNVAGALSAPGVIARSVEDAVLLLETVAQPDARDVECAPPPPEGWLRRPDGIAGLRVALSLDLGHAPRLDPEVAAAVRAAADRIAGLGVEVVEADPPIEPPLETFNTLFRAGFGYALRGFTDAQRALVGETLRDAAARGAAIGLHDYLAAQDARRDLAARFARFFQDYDLLLTPMTSVTAFAADRWVPEGFEDLGDPRAWTPFGYPVNLIQSPAVTLPCGLSSAGLPIGLQIVAPRFGEAVMLALARAYEAARDLALPWSDLPFLKAAALKAPTTGGEG